MSKKSFLSIELSTGSYASMLETILVKASTACSDYICVVNVHMTMEAWKDAAFAKIVREAFMATPDGMPIAWGLSRLYNVQQARVAGMDLLPDLIKEASARNLKIVFYGGSQSVLDAMQQKNQAQFPRLQALYISPPFVSISDEEQHVLIDRINAFKPHLISVCLGCPKQEKWMASMKGKVNGLMIGLGGAFAVYAGAEKRAPLWMQKVSLEWVYRFAQDPKRLWKRYVTTNTLFLLLFFKYYIVKRPIAKQ
jgi:N-acetylglucosaminyldiphosphoundecaprenol N-acetyl-beta-D-mannosaminyltransferase